VGTKDEVMTKKLGRGLGMATVVLALVGVPTLSAYADSGPPCTYPDYTCSPTTTQATTGGGGNGSGGHSGNGTLPPVTKSAGGSGSSGSGTGSATGSGSGATTVSTKAAGGGSLPFTGADIEEMTIGGVGALLLGGLLLRRSRSRRRASV
jgi:hypothetical protein